jgi:predicted TIM-barrel fold metal-dependent hydrolase
MIIDMHVHPFAKEATWPDINKIAVAMGGSDSSKQRFYKASMKIFSTKTSIDDYIVSMDKNGIDKAVIVSFNITTAYGICLVTNDNIADFVKRHPDRFIGFAGIDVPAPDAMEQLDYALNSLELNGVKLVPPVQKFDISDSKYRPLWRKLADSGTILWTHTGHQVATVGAIASLGHPQLIDKLATENEDLTIIMGHMGTPWFWDAWSVVLRHPNVHIDISAHPDLYHYFPWDAFTKYNLEDKVFFASDHPICHWNKILPAFKDVPISDTFKRKILGENAAKLFNITTLGPIIL